MNVMTHFNPATTDTIANQSLQMKHHNGLWCNPISDMSLGSAKFMSIQVLSQNSLMMCSLAIFYESLFSQDLFKYVERGLIMVSGYLLKS